MYTELNTKLDYYPFCGNVSRMRLRIYALVDPRDNMVHYVGKSRNPYVRLGEHYRDHRPPTEATPKGGFARAYNPGMAAWLESLMSDDIFPVIQILHIVEEGEKWETKEIELIAKYRKEGHPLVNITHGGRGTLGMKHTEEWKENIRKINKGRVMTPEQCEKLSKATKGRKPSALCIEKSRERMKAFNADGMAERALKKRWEGKTPEERKAFMVPLIEAARQTYAERRRLKDG